MKTEEDAKELAHAMVRIGNNVGRQTWLLFQICHNHLVLQLVTL